MVIQQVQKENPGILSGLVGPREKDLAPALPLCPTQSTADTALAPLCGLRLSDNPLRSHTDNQKQEVSTYYVLLTMWSLETLEDTAFLLFQNVWL